MPYTLFSTTFIFRCSFYKYYMGKVIVLSIVQLTNNQKMVKEFCSRCQMVPINILVLECEHKICLQCASVLLNLKKYTIKCPNCETRTILDSQIAEELIQNSQKYRQKRIKDKTIKIHTKQKERTRQSRIKNKQNAYTNSNSNQNLYSSLTHPQVYPQKVFKMYCRQHSDYEIMYICNSCNQTFVCPQCVIHGEHRGHDAISFKSFLGDAQQKLQKQISLIENSVQDLFELTEQRKISINQKICDINQLKNLAIQKYGAIKKEISQHENDLIQQLDVLLQCYKNDLDELEFVIHKDIEVLSRRKQQICAIISPLNQKLGEKTKQIEIEVIKNYIKHEECNKSFELKTHELIFGQQVTKRTSNQEDQLEILTGRIQEIDFRQENWERKKKSRNILKESLINQIISRETSNRRKSQESEKMNFSKKQPSDKRWTRKESCSQFQQIKEDFFVF